jgi:hypothetical protein
MTDIIDLTDSPEAGAVEENPWAVARPLPQDLLLIIFIHGRVPPPLPALFCRFEYNP